MEERRRGSPLGENSVDLTVRRHERDVEVGPRTVGVVITGPDVRHPHRPPPAARLEVVVEVVVVPPALPDGVAALHEGDG